MGEVYRARDTTLDRDVAIKVLPDAFASDPERLARFEREAKVLASLNGPGELFVLILAVLCVPGVTLLAVGGQQAATPLLRPPTTTGAPWLSGRWNGPPGTRSRISRPGIAA